MHVGQQGIFRDIEETRGIAGAKQGLTVGLRYTGKHYQDHLSDDGLAYRYPHTDRGERDAQEIASMKTCLDLSMPVFVIIRPTPTARTRNVRLAWVVDFDDAARLFLLAFSRDGSVSSRPAPPPGDSLFQLFESRSTRRTYVKARPNQWRFRFDVMKRYGATCCVCPISDPLVDAAHLCSVQAGGCDDARNGLVFCLNHHRAFDIGLLRINPYDLTVSAPDTIGVTQKSIRHLPESPHPEALVWAWERALEAQDVDLAHSLRASFVPCAGTADQNKEEMS